MSQLPKGSDPPVSISVEGGIVETKTTEKPASKEGKKKKKEDSDEKDVIVHIAFTILAKHIEDEDGKLFLVGTMIYRMLNPPPELERYQLRINDQSPGDGWIEERRGRPADFANTDEKLEGLCVTSQIRLPLKVEQLEGISYPFKVLRAKVRIEFSSPAINGIQYRPSIMELKSDEFFRELICLKHHKKENAKKDDPPEVSYDHEAFDQSAEYDTITPVPNVKLEPEIKGKTMYFPKIDLEWQLTSPYLKPFMGTLIPVLLLLALQWVNWFYTLVSDDADTSGYFTNAITVILALVVLVPTMQGSNNTLRSTISPVEYMTFFFFVGTGLSAVPLKWVSLIGLIITSASMIFPATGVGNYMRLIKKLEDEKLPVKYLLPVPGTKARGELVDFNLWQRRPEVAPKKKEE